ncbi:hypothetical protein KPATCC21470_3028 [Kitasatospora purpeofusca]
MPPVALLVVLPVLPVGRRAPGGEGGPRHPGPPAALVRPALVGPVRVRPVARRSGARRVRATGRPQRCVRPHPPPHPFVGCRRARPGAHCSGTGTGGHGLKSVPRKARARRPGRGPHRPAGSGPFCAPGTAPPVDRRPGAPAGATPAAAATPVRRSEVTFGSERCSIRSRSLHS